MASQMLMEFTDYEQSETKIRSRLRAVEGPAT